jgi:metal-responsive CopG/Arc/MetJ family transcriptional regulator
MLHNMKTIQIVVEEDLLRAADRVARRAKVNRSMLFRAALRDYLRRKRIEGLEERHRRAYERFPEQPGEFDVWDKVLSWPED